MGGTILTTYFMKKKWVERDILHPIHRNTYTNSRLFHKKLRGGKGGVKSCREINRFNNTRRIGQWSLNIFVK